MKRVKYDDMVAEFERVLLSRGFDQDTAHESAVIFARNSVDGVYSHGINRFPRVISYIEKGYIDPKARPTVETSFGAMERWNGNLAMGNTTAKKAMSRAVELAEEHGVGIVAIANTNHWMRGGAFGWQAADAGMIGICWTNTMPNMPAWGAKDRRIGNNPLVIAVPRSNGEHVVVDSALAQFSYGKIEETKLKGKQLPFAGGYDSEGNLTTDPAEIEKTWRVLPMGFWKGSGLSIVLDLVATVLSGGNSTTAVGKMSDDEYGVSQVCIAIDPAKAGSVQINDAMINEVLEDIKGSEKADEGSEILYPGERAFRTRQENLKEGIPVFEDIWESIKKM
ncbi:MAG: 3-dehydro-L-gulonate 2-dehydrogenase [Spirochaetales bacterium]|nr:3-dehydro-L-gulonate 2-dehydrogenase [Spirochaetales bacterium]